MTKPSYKELLEKVKVYERILHDIHRYATIPDSNTVLDIIDKVCEWSHACRAVNDVDQEKSIRDRFAQLKKREYLKEVRV